MYQLIVRGFGCLCVHKYENKVNLLITCCQYQTAQNTLDVVSLQVLLKLMMVCISYLVFYCMFLNVFVWCADVVMQACPQGDLFNIE